MLAWGRLGKVLQFVAGLAVVLDLIGAEPLRAFGRRLTKVQWGRGMSRTSEGVAVVVFAVSFVVYVVFIVLLFVSDYVPALSWRRFEVAGARVGEWLDGSPFGIPIVVGAFFAYLGLAELTHRLLYGGDRGSSAKTRAEYKRELNASLFLAPVVLVATLVVGIVLLPWLLFIYAFCVPVSRGLAWLLDRTQPAHPLRWAAMVLFVVGFHFDLLAS